MKAGALDYLVKSAEFFKSIPRLSDRVLREWSHITERRRAEDNLRKAAVVFDSTSDGIMICDQQNKIVAVNKALIEITGYRESEVMNKSPRMFASGRHDDSFFRSMWQSISETGRWHGELWNRRKTGEVYPELLTVNTVANQDDRVQYYVGVFSDISGIKDAQAQLEYSAHHDSLTGLPNRLLLNARLEHALERCYRNKCKTAVLFLDLDRFKNINDSMGHAYGDELLKAVATRLKQSARKEDTVARMGGDEFVIVVENLKQGQDAAMLADNLLKVFAKPFRIDERELFVNFSIGIALYPNDGKSVESLLKYADAAMYWAKESGRNNYQFYTRRLTAKAVERLAIETDLRYALDREEFEVFYQPQICLATGAVIGVEALVRWRHPNKGLIAPENFISIAEECGIIMPLGEWVLQTACTQIMRWRNEGLCLNNVAVNLSTRQFQNDSLVGSIAKVLRNTGLDAQSLELEITENILMQETEHTLRILSELDEMGVNLAMDDFGTGYSSLSYMKRFPVSKLKIDRSFIHNVTSDEKDAMLATSIIVLGHSMELKVIAEGVETKGQLEFLQQKQCDEFQGHLVSPPLPAQDFERYLRSHDAAKFGVVG